MKCGMRRLAILLIVLLLAFAGLWGARRTIRAHALEVVHPRRGPAVQAIYATGTIEGSIMFPIAPRVTARLIELAVDEGDKVTEGQVLARFEDEEMKEAVRELEAREKHAKEELERQRILFQGRAVSKQEFDSARSEWEAASAAKKAADVKASYLTLYAPAAGEIIRRDGEAGQLVASDRPVFWMVKDGPLRISAEVDEEDISLVQPGQEVLIRGDAFPGSTFKGEVQTITPKGDPIQRSYRVRIRFLENAPVKIGMTAENNIIVRRTDDALLVPSTAVTKDQLWKVREGRLTRTNVTIGARGIKETEILSGVTSDDLIVVRPAPDAADGAEVKVRLIDSVE